MRLTVGHTLNSTYTVERPLGSGAFGEVYLVSHRFLGRQALKLLDFGQDVDTDEAFSEARVLVDLSHPNIVRTYDANVIEVSGQTDGFVTMEFAENGTLADLLNTTMRFSDQEVTRMGVQLASALDASHSQTPPLLHRDVKPSNILVFRDESSLSLKLSDFGMARQLDPETRLASSGGTLAYAPPEMAWGIADERSDVYSLGVTLYRCLTGMHPFPIHTTAEMTERSAMRRVLSHGRKSIMPPSSLLMRPTALENVIMKCLEYDMFDRHKNAQEVLQDLDALAL